MPKAVDLEDPGLFGASDARNPIELEGLKKYFVSLPGFASVAGGRQTIIAGRKGTGKTAIRSHLLSQWQGVVHVDVEPPLASHPLFSFVARSVEGADPASYASYEYAWRAYVLGSILKTLVQENWLGFGDRTALAKYIKISSGRKFPTLQQRVQEIASGFGKLIGMSASVDASFITKALPAESELAPLLALIGSAASAHNKRVVVLVDRVDQQLEQPQLSGLWDRYRKYIGGLCLAVARITSAIDRSRLSFYAFVRDDVLGDILPQLHNATEFRDLVYRLPWRVDQLMDLLGTRLAAAQNENYSPQWPYDTKRDRFLSSEMFYALFERNNLDGYTPWSYFLLHTHMRPRDLIEVCNATRVEAAASQKKMIDGNAINRGMWRSSNTMYHDLVAGYRYMVSDFQRLIDGFRKGALRFSRAELLTHLESILRGGDFLDATQGDVRLDAAGLVRVLYKTGFLVAPIGDRSGGGLPFVAHYSDPHRVADTESTWMVHPAYVREMRHGQGAPNIRRLLDNSKPWNA